MSTEPTGWQAPKTNWTAADVPAPADFNRAEGNANAIETGSRTVDPSQVPAGNAGNLRQLLSWFVNRLAAILGGSLNWWNDPPITLTATKTHVDATSDIHGADSEATAGRIIIRDLDGRAKVAAPVDDAHIARKAEVDAAAAATLSAAQTYTQETAILRSGDTVIHVRYNAVATMLEASYDGGGTWHEVGVSTAKVRAIARRY